MLTCLAQRAAPLALAQSRSISSTLVVQMRPLIGVVTSDLMNKSIVVQVTNQFVHPKFGKIIRKRKKFMAHDETEQCGIGDRVQISECRPISKSKHFRLDHIIKVADRLE